MQRIPPDLESLKLHITRANYISYIQTHFDLKRHPSPLNHGWHLENGRCLPLKPDAPLLPQNVLCPNDLINNESDESENDTADNDENTDDDNSEYWSESDSHI